MHVEPRGMILVWFLQFTTIAGAIAVVITINMMKGAMTDIKNIDLWKDKSGTLIAPLNVNGNDVKLSNMQTQWFTAVWAFLGIALITALSMILTIRKARREGTVWGMRGSGLLLWVVISWVGTLVGIVYLVFGFTFGDIKTLNGNFVPNGADGFTTPELALTSLIAFCSASLLYSLVFALIWWRHRRRVRMYGGGYEGGPEGTAGYEQMY